MKTFFKSFANSASVALIVGLLVITFFQHQTNKEIRSQLNQIQTDTIFDYVEYKDSINGDTLLPVTKKTVINNLVNLNKQVPAVQDLILFANWSAPILNAVSEQSRPKLKDVNGISSFTTFENWIADQKALRAEKQNGSPPKE